MGLDISEQLQEQAEANALARGADVCEVWPENWDALRLFQACQSQREMSARGMGGVMYLPARSVNVAQELIWLGVAKKRRSEVVHQYRIIERETLSIMNARK